MRWRTVDGDTLVEDGTDLALQTLIYGLLAPATILELVRYCMVYEDEGKGPCQRQSKSEPKGSAKCCHFGVGIISI